MRKRGDLTGRFGVVVLLATLSIGPTCRGADDAITDPAWLRGRLEKIRHKHHLPALAAALAVDGEVVAASAVGVRRWGSPVRATRDDPFQLGSVTKTMTATMIARLVQGGVLRWDTTIGEMFPELIGRMDPAYRGVTVVQLLSHTSGMPYQPRTPGHVLDSRGATLHARRYEYVKAAVADPPEAPPGTKVIYSGGPVIVACWIERALKRPYEGLMAELVFGPLGMSRAGFGSNASPGRVDAPWDHILRGGHPIPVPPDPAMAFQTRAPVGKNVHCSVIDLARFSAAHLAKGTGPDPFLSPESLRVLHTPVPPVAFAPGWDTSHTYWARGLILSHNGSIGRNYALAYVAPDEGFATCIMTNIDGEGVGAACGEVNRVLVTGFRRGGSLPVAAEGAGRPPEPDVPLDDLAPVVATTGFGKIQPGRNAAGKPLNLDGDTYVRGIGVHAVSELVYPLRPEYRRFVARVGIDDQQFGHGSVRVEVFADGKLVASSPMLRGGDPPWPVDVAIPSAAPGRDPGVLRLAVGDGGNGHSWDLTDWAEAGFVTVTGD